MNTFVRAMINNQAFRTYIISLFAIVSTWSVGLAQEVSLDIGGEIVKTQGPGDDIKTTPGIISFSFLNRIRDELNCAAEGNTLIEAAYLGKVSSETLTQFRCVNVAICDTVNDEHELYDTYTWLPSINVSSPQKTFTGVHNGKRKLFNAACVEIASFGQKVIDQDVGLFERILAVRNRMRAEAESGSEQ